MAVNNTILKYLSFGLFAFLLSCSPRANKSLLTFLFDGVPAPDSNKTAVSSEKIKSESESKIFRPSPFEVSTDYTVHYPYKEKDCYSCHDEKSKSELKMAQPGLCYQCHDDFSSKYKFVHGPVNAGYCTSCHNPHKSKEKKLLDRSGQQLCLNCHEIKSVLKNKEHKDIADTECTLCHNPHGGVDRFILN